MNLPQACFRVTLPSLAATHQLAVEMAKRVFAPMCICLDGTLGAGKTEWTRAFAVARGADARDVTSPTFMLVHQYATSPPLFHLDAYRLHDEDELLDLGVEEMFEQEAVTIMEWSSRVRRAWPAEFLSLEWDVLGETEREVQVLGCGDRYVAYVQELEQALQDLRPSPCRGE